MLEGKGMKGRRNDIVEIDQTRVRSEDISNVLRSEGLCNCKDERKERSEEQE